MMEIATTLIQETAKETGKSSFSFDEVNKKFSPKELISNSESNGISGDSQEVSEIAKEASDRAKINETSDYSDEVNKQIRTPEELEVYQKNSLEETVVNDKPVLADTSIDANAPDGLEPPKTNLERMERGLAPLDENGEPYNLHHIGQKKDSPLAELKNETHKSEYSTLHDTSIKESDIDRNSFNKERADHWKARAEAIKEERNTNV